MVGSAVMHQRLETRPDSGLVLEAAPKEKAPQAAPVKCASLVRKRRARPVGIGRRRICLWVFKPSPLASAGGGWP